MNNVLQGKKWTDWIQVAVIALSAIMIFTGFITFKNESVRWTVKTAAQKTLSQMNRYDMSDIEDLAEGLQDIGVYISPTKIVKTMRRACNIIKDAKFSPIEMVALSGTYILTGSDKIDALKNVLYTDVSTKYARFLEAFSQAAIMMAIVAVIAIIYLVLAIITLVQKMKNKDTLIYVCAGTGIALTILNLILVAMLNSAFETIVYDFGYGWGKMFSITFTSFLPLLFGVALIAGQIFGSQLGTIMPHMQRTNMDMPRQTAYGINQGSFQMGNMTVCPNCGAQVASDSKFCPVCGGAVTTEQKPTCPNCHTQISEDTTFCPVCGTKCK